MLGGTGSTAVMRIGYGERTIWWRFRVSTGPTVLSSFFRTACRMAALVIKVRGVLADDWNQGQVRTCLLGGRWNFIHGE